LHAFHILTTLSTRAQIFFDLPKVVVIGGQSSELTDISIVIAWVQFDDLRDKVERVRLLKP